MTEQGEAQRTRLDRWLWAARFFKSRSLATAAVSGGHVHVNGHRARPSRLVGPGDSIEITRGPWTWTVVVRDVCERRRSAPLAQRLYEETAESRARRERLRAELSIRAQPAPPPERLRGRPTKRDRRRLERIRARSR